MFKLSKENPDMNALGSDELSPDTNFTAGMSHFASNQVPAGLDLWPQVERRLEGSAVAARRASTGPRMRILAIVVTAGVAVGLIATAAAQAGGFVPIWVGQGTGSSNSITGSGQQVSVPAVSFRSAVPSYVPQLLTRREYAHIPPRRADGMVDKASVLSGPEGVSDLTINAIATLQAQGREAVYMWFSSGAGQYLSVTEQSALSTNAQSGKAIVVGGAAATIEHASGHVILRLVANGTAVVIETDLSDAEAIKVASSLKWT
ncbi:MAG TPA: hypothetical protein VNZ53_31465 [Steroidobacteraceae bacterium]|jgi:hypothetical protein|nr:hypothetical protein [Steroidobacteraceae bacterium]